MSPRRGKGRWMRLQATGARAIAIIALAGSLAATGCATLHRAEIDTTWFTEGHSGGVIGAITVSAESDRILGEYPYDLEELVTLAGTAAGFVFAELDRATPDTQPAPEAGAAPGTRSAPEAAARGTPGGERHRVGAGIIAHVSDTESDIDDYRPPLEVDVDIRERGYTRGVSRVQAMVARVRLSSLESTREERTLAVAVYRADSTESIISYFHVYEVLLEVFTALRENAPDSTEHREAAD